MIYLKGNHNIHTAMKRTDEHVRGLINENVMGTECTNAFIADM